MPDLKTEFAELVSLCQLYLLREHTPDQRLVSDPKTYHFFQGSIKKEPPKIVPKKIEPPKPTIINSPPPPPPPPTSRPTEIPKPAPLPPPKPEIAAPLKAPAPFFALEPFNAATTVDLEEYKNLIKTLFPNFPIRNDIPSDQKAKAIKNGWRLDKEIPPILIISVNDQDKHLAFLKNVAQAITLHIAPAKVISGPAIEKEKKWDEIVNTPGLRLIISNDYGLYLLPGLMLFYNEDAKEKKHYIKQTPLLLLSDVSLYLKEPALKAALWQMICKASFGVR